MALTRDFKDTVKARAERDPEFRMALLEEAAFKLEALIEGIKQAQASLDRGEGIPFAEVMEEMDALIEQKAREREGGAA